MVAYCPVVAVCNSFAEVAVCNRPLAEIEVVVWCNSFADAEVLVCNRLVFAENYLVGVVFPVFAAEADYFYSIAACSKQVARRPQCSSHHLLPRPFPRHRDCNMYLILYSHSLHLHYHRHNILLLHHHGLHCQTHHHNNHHLEEVRAFVLCLNLEDYELLGHHPQLLQGIKHREPIVN